MTNVKVSSRGKNTQTFDFLYFLEGENIIFHVSAWYWWRRYRYDT